MYLLDIAGDFWTGFVVVVVDKVLVSEIRLKPWCQRVPDNLVNQ